MKMAVVSHEALTANGATTDHGEALNAYLVRFAMGRVGLPGAPVLHVAAVVNAPTGRMSGHARITQAIAPPGGMIAISDVTGQIRSLGFGESVRVVTLSGTYEDSFPPPAIGTVTQDFSATLVLEQDRWTGQGSFSYGQHHIDDVPVTLEEG
jgi:Domain of unknown function (DUF1842)